MKKGIIVTLVLLVSFLHYATGHRQLYYHVFYSDLYYLPLILAGIWFGLRGAVVTSIGITLLFFPYMLMTWRYMPLLDFDRTLEIVLLNSIAIVLGVISDRERASQKALNSARNLAAIGEAVAGVAHDLKAPLTAIGGLTRLVHRRLPEGDPNREKLGVVVSEVDRLDRMVRDMLDFSRPFSLNLSRHSLKEVVESVLPLVEVEAKGRGLRVDTEFRSVAAPLQCDLDRLKQALLNLIINAMQVTGVGGRVRIRARQEGARAVFEVIDEGPGIPEGIREDIFLPFFTTKSGGTGLGLAIVSKIVQAHKGRIRVLENPDKGMTFRIVLPVTRRKPSSP